jgi:Ca2+-dependent lipid-binding protein
VERLRYKIKNQALREYMLGVLDTDKEYVEWFNQFLARFWMNYEPELSKGLKANIGATLDTIKAPGIDEIVLSKFTLGSQAPRIDSIKTFANTSDEVLILDFDLSFTPFDADAISKKEKMRRELRNLEIVLLAKFAMVPLPVSLKELFINGTLRLQFTFMSAYPHIKVIDLGFVKVN